ncbi:MAG: DUF6677 family protein [Phycisphaerae bacterium]
MKKPDPLRVTQAGILAWILPGAGHWFLGHRGLAVVFFAAISFPYLTGLAYGGVKNSINPKSNKWLFLAEMGVGGYTTAGYFVGSAISVPAGQETRYIAFFPESDIAMIYLSTAGLLNVLAILDALTRAQTGGLPVFYPEIPPAERVPAAARRGP